MKENKYNINPKKAPGFNPIIGEIVKLLPRKVLVKLNNATFWLKYVL